MSSGYEGDLSPSRAWEMLRDNPDAVLVDVRTEAEWRYVGTPDLGELRKQAIFAEWNTASGRNPDFVAELKAAGISQGPVLFLCRSGQRSIGAAQDATTAGITPAYNISDGFEGALDADGHRGGDGWRAAGLAWKQS